MVNKKQESEPAKPKTKTASKREEKQVLLDLVKKSDVRLPVIVAALVEAGLYKEYEEQLDGYGKITFKPTITQSEFDKIIRKMEGE